MHRTSTLTALISVALLLGVHRDAHAMLQDASINHDIGKLKRNIERMIHSDHAFAVDSKPTVSGAGKATQ